MDYYITLTGKELLNSIFGVFRELGIVQRLLSLAFQSHSAPEEIKGAGLSEFWTLTRLERLTIRDRSSEIPKDRRDSVFTSY